MAFRDLRQRLNTSVAQLDRVRLQDRYQGLDVTAIADAPRRVPIRIGGEVQETRIVPQAGAPSLRVTIDDGSGRAIAMFPGRTKIPGMGLGKGVLFEGVGREEKGHLVLLNPAYTLL